MEDEWWRVKGGEEEGRRKRSRGWEGGRRE